MPADDKPDTIRNAVIAAADRHGLTAYALAKATEGKVSESQMHRFFSGECHMSTEKLQHILPLLGLRISGGKKVSE